MSVTRGDVIVGVGNLVVEECPSCGVIYAIPETLKSTALRHKKNHSVYCPNGHSWHYLGKTPEEELRETRDALAAANARRDQAEASERMARAREEKERKAKQRLQARAAAGVCPHCNRTFQQLARHMKTKHHEETPSRSTTGGE